MGWWKSKEKHIIGDGPADDLGTAVDSVVSLYQRDFERMPTKEEVQACFDFVIAPYPESYGDFKSKKIGKNKRKR